MKISRASAYVAGVTTALVLGTGTAFASGGASVLLGHGNKTTHTTTISDTKGTPLSLKAKSGRAPLAVNSRTKVKNLNADTVDGLSSGSLALTRGRTGIIAGTAADADKDPSTARCPSGTIATGGGGIAADGDTLAYSGPNFSDTTGKLASNSWYADGATKGALAYVVCYNPRGAVKGASTSIETILKNGTAASVASSKRAALSR